MLDIDKIRQLVEMMVANELVEISLRDGEEEVNLRRPNPNAPAVAPSVAAMPPPVDDASALPPPVSAAVPTAEADADDDKLVHVSAPMVGTFYAAPDPESEPFVGVGSEVQPGTVVCILEAMKVFSEIKAEVAGIVERILVKNADPVEYGQPLLAVRPL